jgi:hypothetical protein
MPPAGTQAGAIRGPALGTGVAGGDGDVELDAVGGVKSLALAHVAAYWAPCITQSSRHGSRRLEPVRSGIIPRGRRPVDTWWRGEETVIAVYRGEAHLFGDPALQAATVYSGNKKARYTLTSNLSQRCGCRKPHPSWW